MRSTIAVLLLLYKCLIFELVTSELSVSNQPACPLKICTDVLKDFGATDARLKALEIRLADSEAQIEEIKKESRGRPKVAFSASLGSNGFYGPVDIDTTLLYKSVFINVGDAYDPSTGIFTAPVRGVYYFSFFYHCGPEHPTGLFLYKNGNEVARTHHHSQKEGYWYPQNGGNGVTLLLEKGDKVYIKLLKNTWIWDTDSVTMFSGFLIDAM
ncbi:hypothetical protein R3I93_001302 [Phoxinus phoxinus]|uniref:C1q domain-containing protein n=1 Tax=Phoxinus phoxinus TaxID=58324 RepID=A0AAN9DGZ5_9TELE